MTALSVLEIEIIKACKKVRDYIVDERPKAVDLGKDGEHPAYEGRDPSSLVTIVDRNVQELILLHLAATFPELYITVEENIDPKTQTVIQQLLYGNRDTAKYMLALDAIDNTEAYLGKQSSNYGICAAILERTGPDTCRYRLAIFYYPETRRFLIARGKNDVVWMTETGEETPVTIDQKTIDRSTISDFQSHRLYDGEKFGLKSLPFKNDGEAMIADILGLIYGRRAGYLQRASKLIDIGMGAFILDCLGFHAMYEDGTPLGDVMWGDRIGANGIRTLARMPDKTLILARNERLYDEMKAHIDGNRL